MVPFRAFQPIYEASSVYHEVKQGRRKENRFENCSSIYKIGSTLKCRISWVLVYNFINSLIILSVSIHVYSRTITANIYSITVSLEMYLSRSNRYQEQPGLTLRFWMPQRKFWTRLNSPVPKKTQSQMSNRLNSLVIKPTQAIEIATQAISQPGLTPRFWRTHSPNLNSYNSTRTQAIFPAIFDLIANHLGKISTRIIQWDHN